MTKSAGQAVHEKPFTRSEADEIARAIATAAADQILARAAEADELGLPFAGSFDVEIEYEGKTYGVTLSSPSAENGNGWVVDIQLDDYLYSLTIKPPPGDSTVWHMRLTRQKLTTPPSLVFEIASFTYVNMQNWQAHIGLPQPIVFESFTIKELSLTISRGTLLLPLKPVEPAIPLVPVESVEAAGHERRRAARK